MIASNRKVWLLTLGSGEDGDEWIVHSIHETRQGAERAKEKMDAQFADVGVKHQWMKFNIEEWPLHE